MSEQALAEAIRAGDLAGTFLALCSMADDAWLAHSPDDRHTVGVTRIGSTNIAMDMDGDIMFHRHTSDQAAHACFEGTREGARAMGWHVVDDDVARAALDRHRPEPRVPDALVELAGRPAEAYFV